MREPIVIEYEELIGGKIRTVASYEVPADSDLRPYHLTGWSGLWDPADDGSNLLLFTTPRVRAEYRRILAKPYVPGECIMHEADGRIWFSHPAQR